MPKYFNTLVLLILISGSGSAAAEGEYLIMKQEEPEKPWSALDIALREAMNTDPTFTRGESERLSRDAAVAGWRRFLQRPDLSGEQQAFAWWRIGSLYAYNFDPRRGETADNMQAKMAVVRAREILSTLICLESLNSATLYSSLPGTPIDQARRLGTAFNWIATRTDADIESSSHRISQGGYSIDARFFPGMSDRSSTLEKRKQFLRKQLSENRAFIAGRVTDAITYSRDSQAIGELLESIKASADPKEMAKWRAMYHELNLKAGKVSTPRANIVLIILGGLSLGPIAFGYLNWRRRCGSRT